VSSPPLAVVVPAGPADDVGDTISSVLHFTTRPRLIVVVDDTGRDVRVDLEALSPDVHVIRASTRAPGGFGGLWVKVAAGYQHALTNFEFEVLLRLDADALVIGPGIAETAAERFAEDSRVGMLGSYRVEADGHARSWADAAGALSHECGLRGMDRPHMRRILRALRAAATAHGYLPGEHALGGAYLLSALAVRTIAEHGWLELLPLRQSRLGEDHLFALITVAAGFHIADFGGPADPLALKWRGLPAAPQELLTRRKLITHSVRSWESLDEREIRAIFAEARGALPESEPLGYPEGD
jgi:hypothetical protein